MSRPLRRTFPVSLLVSGRHCLVVGGGHVAARKTEALLDAGALVTVVAPEICDEMATLDVAVELRRYERDDLVGYALGVAATGDAEVDKAVFEDGERAGIFVNAADDPEHCSFILPAVARRGPISVAVSTEGVSPALATWLRDRLAAALPAETEQLAALVAQVREQHRASGRPTEGLDWHGLIDEMADALSRADPVAAARAAARWAALASEPVTPDAAHRQGA